MLLWLRRISLIALELLGAAIAAALVLGALLAWRLSSGPLRLDALEPYLLSGLSQLAEPYQVSIGQTAITWGRDRTSIGLEATQVRILTREGVTVAAVPEVELGLSVPALVLGRVAPTRVRLVGPRLRAVRTQEGDVRLSLFDTGSDTPAAQADSASSRPSDDLLESWFSALAAPPQASSQFGALRRVEISGARLEVDDYRFGVRWSAPRFEVNLRRDRDGMRGDLALHLALGTRSSIIKGDLLYDRLRSNLRFDLALDHFNPAELAAWSPSFADLGRVNLPFSGKLSVQWARPFGVSQLDFDMEVGAGTLQVVEGQPAVGVEAAELSGTLDRLQRRLDVHQVFADFTGGTRISGSANARRVGDDILITALADAEKVSAAELAHFWPATIARGARGWITKNITAGHVPQANIKLDLMVPLADLENPVVTGMEGGMQLVDAEVNYFRPLPPATNAQGVASFNRDVFNVKISSAQVGNLRITEGNIDLLGLQDDSERADITLTVNGTVADQLALLDHEPLGYARRLNIKADQTGGRATTRARFMFPLFGNLPIGLVAISASSNMRDVSIPAIVAGQSLTRGQLTLELDGGGMKIAGTGNIGPAAAEFSWQESFVGDVSPGSEISFKGVMDEAARRAFRVSWQDVLRGEVGVMGTYTKDRGQAGRLEAELNFAKSTLELPWFAWIKEPGTPASGNVAVTIDRNQVREVSSFRLSGGGANVRGSVSFAAGSQWQRVRLDRIEAPGTSLAGSVRKLENGSGFALDFKGNAADIRGIYEPRSGASAAPASVAAAEDAATASTQLLPLDITFDIGRVVTGEGRVLSHAAGHIIRNERGWRHIELDGQVENDVPVRIRLVPIATGREINITTQNAGAMLSTLRLMDNIHGGTLAVVGTGEGLGPVSAVADMQNFIYLQPKTLQRIAEAASPEGAEVLARGEGIEFTRLKARFLYGEDHLEVTESRMASEVLGLTMSGRIDLLHSRIDMNGTLVPLYGLNSAVGGIPILGWLLTGGEGGGIFAATYSVKGPLRAPETSVNPLAMLAPGFLRNILFMGGD